MTKPSSDSGTQIPGLDAAMSKIQLRRIPDVVTLSGRSVPAYVHQRVDSMAVCRSLERILATRHASGPQEPRFWH